MKKDIIEEITENMSLCSDYYSDIYEKAEYDYKFAYGSQWSEDELSQRSNKINLTLNQLLPYAHQVVNEIKKMRMGVKISPYDDMADIKTAEVMQDAIRSIERYSSASDVYSWAASNAVLAGTGWIEITTDYASEMSFDIEPKIERVIDFKSVYLDPESEDLDGSDASFAFKFVDIPKAKFEQEYPDIQPMSYDIGCADKWINSDTVRIADYYVKERKKDKIYKVRVENILTGETKTNVVNRKELKLLKENEIPFEVLNERDTFFEEVKIYKTNGVEIIEESNFPSQYIPIIPVYGEEVFLNGKHYGQSLVRQAVDAQRSYNIWKSYAADMVALQPRNPFIGPIGSFKSDKGWGIANSANLPYLEYDVVHDRQGNRVEPPRRESPPQISPTITQEAIGARDDIRMAIGIYESGLGQAGNEVSGVAIRQRQIKGENATYHFTDNLASSITHVGRILIDMIPQVYSDRQWLRVFGSDGSERKIPINANYKKEGDKYRLAAPDEIPDGIYRLGLGKYDIVPDIGGSYASERQETADKLIELTTARPELITYVGDLLFAALDLPMSQEIADRLKSQMPPELLSDDPMAAQLETAMQAMAQMEEQLKNYEAALQDKSSKDEIDRQIKLQQVGIDQQDIAIKAEKTKAEVEKIRADALKTLSELNQSNAGVQELQEQINMLSQAIENIADIYESDEENGNEPAENGLDKLENGDSKNE